MANEFSMPAVKGNTKQEKGNTKEAALEELMKESIKRTNLSAPISLLNTVSMLKDCLMRQGGRKVTLDNLYVEALIDLLEKYNKQKGDHIIEDFPTFSKHYKMLGLDNKDS